jgi:Uma2 family endonuclease
MNALAKRQTEERDPRLWTADQFLDFYMTRPDGERWQLVDGLAIMMVPPSMVHQRIVGNLGRLLNEALRQQRPDLFAYENIGLRIPGLSDFNPQPDIAVCSSKAAAVYYQDQFYLVAEVASRSNKAEMTDRKLDLYRSHPDNLYCLSVEQESVHVTCYARDNSWAPTDLGSLDDILKLPAFGLEARLADIYDGTPLAR